MRALGALLGTAAAVCVVAGVAALLATALGEYEGLSLARVLCIVAAGLQLIGVVLHPNRTGVWGLVIALAGVALTYMVVI